MGADYPNWLITTVEVLRWATGLAFLVVLAYYYPGVFLVLRILVAVFGQE